MLAALLESCDIATQRGQALVVLADAKLPFLMRVTGGDLRRCPRGWLYFESETYRPWRGAADGVDQGEGLWAISALSQNPEFQRALGSAILEAALGVGGQLVLSGHEEAISARSGRWQRRRRR